MGAGMAECAQLRAKMGGGGGGAMGGIPGLGGLGGMGGAGKAGAAAGLLGSLMGAAQNAQAARAQQAPAANPQATQQAIAVCVQRANGDVAAIQSCLALANQPAAPQGLMGQGIGAQGMAQGLMAQGMPPTDTRGQASAMATYQAGQNYHACVAANPNNWQMCQQAMANNAQAGLLNAGVSPQQLQAAGLPGVPGGQAGAAAAGAALNALGGLFGRK